MKKFGVTQEVLGVTPHGLRHEYAGDRYEAARRRLTAREGWRIHLIPRRTRRARLQVAEELGHARRQISSAYLGSPRTGRPRERASGPDPAEEPGA